MSTTPDDILLTAGDKLLSATAYIEALIRHYEEQLKRPPDAGREKAAAPWVVGTRTER
jgi:hypothetical protein